MDIPVKKTTNVFEQKTKETKQQGTESFGITEPNQSLPEEKIAGAVIQKGTTAQFNDNIASGKTNTTVFFNTETNELLIYNPVLKEWKTVGGGEKGDPGDPGESATVTVGETTTLEPGNQAAVVNSGTSSAAVLDFSIPKGAKGDKGDQGDAGIDGIDGTNGTNGLGVPAGGLTGEVLKKKSDDDNDTEWGEGGTSSVVNNDPLGTIYPFTAATIPEGYLLCDGAAISRSTYADLFAVIGITYGAGDGTTTFNLPNIAGKTIVGKSAETEFDTLGEVGGAKTHTLDVTQIPSHQHRLIHYNDDYNNTGGGTGFGFTYDGTNTPVNDNYLSAATGGGLAHNNLQPYITLNYIIKAQISAGVQGLKGDKGDPGEPGNNGNSFITNETPSGTVNGTNVTFTLAGVPISGTLQLFRDGQLLTQGGDYTLSSSTVTFVTAPVSGSVLIANYQLTVNTVGNADTVDGYHASSTPTANQIPVFDANGLLALSALGYKVQAGNATISVAGGSADYTVTLTTAWTTEHLAFFLFAYPLSSWSGVSILGGGIPSGAPLTTGFARINTTSTQNFKICWISIGK